MTTQIAVMYLNEPTVKGNVQQEKEMDVTMDMDISMDMLDKMDVVVEQKEKVLEEGSDREDSEVDDDDEDAVPAVPKSQDIFVDRVGNKNKNKQQQQQQPSSRKSLDKKSKSFTLRATKRLFKSFSKRKSSSSSSSSTKDDTLQAAAVAAAVVPASLSISTKPTFDSTTNESEEEKEDLFVDMTEEEEEQQQQQQQEATADEVTDEEDADDDTVDVSDVIDNDEDEDHIKSEAEGVKEVQVQVEEVETAPDDAVINKVTEPSPPFIKEQGVKTDGTTNENDDDDDDDEDDEQHKLEAEGAKEIQELEATTAANTVTNTVLDSSSSVEVVLTPFVKEQEKKEEETSPRTLLFVAMWMLVGIAINIYCHSNYYELFIMDQGQQQLQELVQEDVTIVQVVQAATNVTPKRNVVSVVAKWVRTIITNKQN